MGKTLLPPNYAINIYQNEATGFPEQPYTCPLGPLLYYLVFDRLQEGPEVKVVSSSTFDTVLAIQ